MDNRPAETGIEIVESAAERQSPGKFIRLQMMEWSMFGARNYNYRSFSREQLRKHLTAKTLPGPRAGEEAPDFELTSLEGAKIRLSDYAGEKNVVLTFGSATCPMTAGSIRGLNHLHEEYSDDEVQFLFV
ncbi:MAG TPA: redoxin domain-containing protein, partial [Terriglobales bacterium]|nr:redoxin domain-containing protein [Terriglobales bacterium]